MDSQEQITFEEILKASPTLGEIKILARDWYQKPDRWQNYERLKSAMRKHIGYTARSGLPSFMYTMEAYDVAYKAIFREGQNFEEPEEEEEAEY